LQVNKENNYKMDLNKLTIKAQEAVQSAQQLAFSNQSQSIEIAHLLKGILNTDKDVAPYLLKKNNVNLNIVTSALDKIISSFPKVTGGGQEYLSRNGNQALQYAFDEAQKLKDEFITIEHILLGVLKTSDQAAQLLKDAGLTDKGLRKAIEELRKGETVTSHGHESNFNALGKYAKNLNELAKNGKLDPVIGRDEEIRRVLQILTRRTKNNPVLIGEPGVGKTAIAEGIAHRIVNKDVPENLLSKQIYSLDMGSLVAGAKYKGEFEERLKSVVKEVTTSDGEIILFIDEMHTLVGAGGGEGAMDAANILKPALARGELRSIGATTLNEYQKYIEKDKALERRFQKVYIDEPNAEDAVSILRGIKEKYENHHKVLIKDEAVLAAVELSQRYITDRFLPDKAIDLIDEAASKLRMEINSKPEELDELDRKIMQLEIEREAIKREKDTKKIEHLSLEISELNEKRDTFMAKWKAEKELLDKMQTGKQNIENFKQEADAAERNGDYGKVAELRYGKIVEEEKKIEELRKQLNELQKNSKLLKEEVTAEEIAEVVSKWVGVPVHKMLESEREKLLRLEDELHKRVIGQDEAIAAVSDAIRRSRSGLQDKRKPIGSFIFIGTTGVGKTELAKALSEYLFNDENAMTRIDMSEYQEKHAVSRLVGAPPGYVGYEEGGQLTEAVRRKPYSVILLDEIEKAHPDVFNILLQVLDDGRLTDNKGRVANFKNTIIIMTSNLGSHIIQEKLEKLDAKNRDKLLDETKDEVMELLRASLRPEFYNRIDEIVMFTPLTKNELEKIVRIQLLHVNKLLAENNMQLHVTKEALNWLTATGYDPAFGARPVKRLIQKTVLNELSKSILGNKIKSGDHAVMDLLENHIVFRQPIKQEEEVPFGV
jgi:ATP-dependent Clp protease ATP-binding subunit ClpB